MRPLLACLFDYPLVLLRAIAEMRRVHLAEQGQTGAADQLAAALAEPHSIRAAVDSCRPEAVAALRELLRTGGRITLPAFERNYGTLRSYGPGRLAREAPWRNPINAFEELWYRGLIARGFAPLGDRSAEFVFVPSDVLPHLPLEPAPAPVFDLPPASPPAHACLADDALLEDACTLLCFVQGGGGWTDARGRWRSRSLAALNERLLQPAILTDFDASKEGSPLAMLLHLAVALAWLSVDRLHVQLRPAAVQRWLKQPRPQQREALWAAWRDSHSWDDLHRVPTLDCERTWGHNPQAARHRILAHLSSCKAGVWYEIDDFLAAVKSVDADFLRPDGRYDTWYVKDRASARYLRGFETWDQVEGALINYLIAGPTHWLGAADLGRPRAEDAGIDGHRLTGAPGPPDSYVAGEKFRLTHRGAAWLGQDIPASSPETSPRLSIQADFRVLAPVGSSCWDRFQLARFADWEASGPTFRYRITQRSLQRADDQDIDAARIVPFLRRASGDALPPNVVRALTNWEKPS